MRTLFLALAWTLLMAASACSLMVDTSTTQCRSDRDCARFGAVCSLEQRVCVSPVVSDHPDASHTDVAASPGSNETPDAGRADTPGDLAAPRCTGPGGCFACTPTSEEQILSLCTDSLCVPFDNARVTLLTSDGHLRPLP